MKRSQANQRRDKKSATASGLDLEAKRLANRKVSAEIGKIKAETEIMHKQFRLAVVKVVFAGGGLLATLVTILEALIGS